jgi:hypothetical protein
MAGSERRGIAYLVTVAGISWTGGERRSRASPPSEAAVAAAQGRGDDAAAGDLFDASLYRNGFFTCLCAAVCIFISSGPADLASCPVRTSQAVHVDLRILWLEVWSRLRSVVS